MTTAAAPRRDPFKQVFHPNLLKLAADLIQQHKQDPSYWNSVPVPVVPGDRLAFEELRQLAVFSPLALVALAYISTSNALVALAMFVLVTPLMYFLHNRLMDAIRREAMRQQARDGGRYRFTTYLCETLGFKPEEVTYDLLSKMHAALREHVAEEAPKIRAAERAERQARDVARGYGPREPYRGRRQGGYAAYTAGGAAAAAGVATMAMANVDQDTGEMFGIPGQPMFATNSANGLPMLNDAVDVHGNAFGLTNVDDMATAAFDATVDFGTGAGAGLQDIGTPDVFDNNGL